jgi:aspartate carbamoyltransferase catalytic subunit
MGVQIYIIRHACSGVPEFLQENTNGIIINAGDGKHEHPTQALLDSFTLYRHFGKLEGIKLCLIGDVLHSRVARSNMTLLKTLGVEVGIFSPGTLIPSRQYLPGIKMLDCIDEVIDWSDVLVVLRLQRERMEAGLLPSMREFSLFFGVTLSNFSRKPRLALLHPGPVNYGIELDYRLATHPNVLIQTQVTHGVFIRMALLYLLAGND